MLLTNLPTPDAYVDYSEQADLLRVCNLALLDEVKRLESENREVRSLIEKKQLTQLSQSFN
jgi:hypothetical protein